MDASTMTINGQKPNNQEPQAQSRKWWKDKTETIHESAIGVWKILWENDSARRTSNQIGKRLYANINIVGASGTASSKVQSQQKTVNDRLTYNLVQSVIDTLQSKMAKNRPKAMFLTSQGDWDMQNKAEMLEKYVDGIFYANKAHQMGKSVMRDSLFSDAGCVKVFKCNDQIKYERVDADEITVDQVESQFAKPRQLFQVKNVDRDVLKDLYPSKKAIIDLCNKAVVDSTGSNPNIADLVTVLEAWHLPSGPEAKDGKHLICINSGTLFIEPYAKDYFPFAFLQWSPRVNSFWGQSLAEQLQNLQLEINKVLWVIQRSMHMAGSFKVLCENGSNIVTEHLTNDVGAIIFYNETPPQYITPPPLQQEWFTHLQNCKQLGFEQAGISQLSATSVKPAGLNSGKALRTMNDIESERFLSYGKDYEQFYLDLTKITIEEAKDLYEELRKSGKKHKLDATFVGKKFIETIPWEDVSPEDDEFVLKAYPVSSLPNDPVGRLQTIEEYREAGYLQPRTARKLLDFPDLDQEEDLANAEEDYLNMILEKICNKGEMTPIDNFDDPVLARELALQYMAKAKLHNLKPIRIEMLSRFISQIDALLAKADPANSGQQDPSAPAQSPNGMPPQGPTTANTTSPIVQNVNGGQQ